jgi:leucyl-tRNA synthetase
MQEALELVVLMLSPIVPHITHTLWAALGHADAVLDCAWPVVDQSALVQDSITLVVQVNGKVRGRVDVPADASRESIEAVVLAEGNVQKHMDGKMPRKVIVVPGKLVNIVV